MKILHVIPSLAVEDGGPTVAIQRFAHGLYERGVSVTILSTSSEGRAETVKLRLPEGVKVICLRRNLQPYKISLPAIAWLRKNVRNYDVVHIHAVFSFLSVVGGMTARHYGVPYIVRPLGVLNRWGMRSGRSQVKRISYHVVESRLLRGASFIHFTSQHEADETFSLDPGLRKVPSFILPIPIGRDDSPATAAGAFCERFPRLAGRKILLFLSRFGPQKGIELAIEAFAGLGSAFDEWTLVLAGGGDAAYETALKSLAHRLDLRDRLEWTGYLSGIEKWSAFDAADAFVLPSYSESFGIAAAEALASGLPAILSDRIPFAKGAAARGGARLVDLTMVSVREGMAEILSDENRRRLMRSAAQAFAEENFTSGGVASELLRFYQHACDDAAKRARQ